MTVYDYLIQTVQSAALSEDAAYKRIVIDLPGRCIWRGREAILMHGRLMQTQVTDSNGRAVTLEELIAFGGDPYDQIQRLYAQFKRSVPGKKEKLNRGCFKALCADELSMEELENNLPRYEARVRLEAFICLAAAAGLIDWQTPRHFFWQGQDPDCIIYRNWIIPNDKFEEAPYEKTYSESI